MPTLLTGSISLFIDCSKKAFELLKSNINLYQEEFWIITLNSSLRVLGCHLLFRGTAQSCQIHPRDIFRIAIADNSTSFIIAHNHPSGSATPSAFDRKITKKIKKLSILMEIPLVDHLIFTQNEYFSFADKKIL